MLSLKSRTDVSNQFFVTAMVDWDHMKLIQNLERNLKKAIKKSLKISSISANRINTFMVLKVGLRKIPSLEEKQEVEIAVRQVLSNYGEKLNKVYREELVYNGDSDVYHDAFDELELNLSSMFHNRRHGLLDDIEDQVESIISTASLMIWDMEGHDGDRIILPDEVAMIDMEVDYTENIAEIADLVDELIIANFSGYFLPFSADILKHAIVGVNNLSNVLDNNQDFGRLSVQSERCMRNFIGSISGLQESLKLFKRIVNKLQVVLTDVEHEFHSYPSTVLHDWINSLTMNDCTSILTAIESLNSRISEVKPVLRMLLKSEGETKGKIDDLFLAMVEVKAISGAIVQFTRQFSDIPSFTTLHDGIAFETVENEEYMKSDPHSLLEVVKLFKLYRRGGGTIYALRGIDFSISEGEFVVIQGSSGSGKTTLLNMLAGLDQPDRGAVFFKNIEINSLTDRNKARLRRENYSFIFQSYALLPHLTAYENVALPIEMGGLSKDLKGNIQTLLVDVGIGEYGDHKPAHLSGGQMQRLGIARALANNPSIIFADEPTGDLDEKTGEKVMKLLKKYHEETGVTIILVTHNPEIVRFGTRQIFVEDGQITSF